MNHLNRHLTEIRIETHSVTTIRTRGRRSALCKICGENLDPVSETETEDAARVSPLGDLPADEESAKGDTLTEGKYQSGE